MKDNRQEAFRIKFKSVAEVFGVAPKQVVSLKFRELVRDYGDYYKLIQDLEKNSCVTSLVLQKDLSGPGYLLTKDAAKAIVVEHETGLELLYIAGSIASLVGIIPMILKAWNGIRGFVPSNPFASAEVRVLDGTGQLHEAHIPINHHSSNLHTPVVTVVGVPQSDLRMLAKAVSGDSAGCAVGKDFFISYSGKDAPTARLFREWLEEAGYSTFMQEPDFPPTSYIPHKMEEGMMANRLLAVLSQNYLNSDYCQAEIGAALMRDPLNKTARLVIVRISECDIPQLWSPISRIELPQSGANVRDVFLKGVNDLPPISKVSLAKNPRTQRKSLRPALSNSEAVQPAGNVATASGDGSIATIAGRDVHLHFDGKKKARGRAKAPADVITENQAVQLKLLMQEVIELDSGSPGGMKLTEAGLKKKWWGALQQIIPSTTYTNYSQSRYNRAMKWLRQHRSRIAAGAADDEPAMSAGVMIRAIHTYISRNKLDKTVCYNNWSIRLNIAPPFKSSKDLSFPDLKRVYGAMRRDASEKV
jgi:hypothetical protein